MGLKVVDILNGVDFCLCPVFVLPIWCLRSMVIVITFFNALVAIFSQIWIVFPRSRLRGNRLENYCARSSDLC